MDKRNIELRLKNIFERYDNVTTSKKSFAFELEFMYADALSFTAIVTRNEAQSKDLNYIKNRISEAMKSTDIQAFRLRKVNGLTAKATADNWEEFILRDDKPAIAPQREQQPQAMPNFGGFSGFQIEGEQITPEGLAGFIDKKIGAVTAKYEQENLRNTFELQKMQELNGLKQELFKLEFEGKADKKTIADLEKQVAKLEAEIEELEAEIEELEEIAGQVEAMQKKTETSALVIKAAGSGLAGLVQKYNPALGSTLSGLFGMNDEQTETDTQTAPPPPPPPIVDEQQNESQDEKSLAIAQLGNWLKTIEHANFEKIWAVLMIMYKDANQIQTIYELTKS